VQRMERAVSGGVGGPQAHVGSVAGARIWKGYARKGAGEW